MTGTAATSGIAGRFRRGSGEFVDRSLEREYRSELLIRNAGWYRRLACWIGGIVVAFTLVDLSSLGPGDDWAALLGSRIVAGVAVASVGLQLGSTPSRFVDRSGRIELTVAQLLLFGSMLAATALRPDDALTSTLSLVVVLLAAMVVVPGRYVDQLVVATLLLVAFVGIAVTRFDPGQLPVVPLLANLVGAWLWGAASRVFSDREHRRSWLAARREHAVSERLNAELAVAHQLRQELQQLARQDPLTSLANRRELLRVADAELSGAPGERCSALLLLDVDGFKAINDQLGHATGDAALVMLADVTVAAVRPGDLVARIGGEEFAVLLPDADDDTARSVAERVRRAIASVATDEHDGFSLTVSIGWTTSRPGDSVDDLLARADTAMYSAKRAGGNRVGGNRVGGEHSAELTA